MLAQLRRLKHIQKFIIILSSPSCWQSVWSFSTRPPDARSAKPTRPGILEVVAKVGSDSITVADVARIRENYAQMFGGRVNLAQLGGNKRFLDGLNSNTIFKAERLGLMASDEELRDRIRKQFSNASGQFVGFERYKEAVVARYGDIDSLKKTFEMRLHKKNCAHL